MPTRRMTLTEVGRDERSWCQIRTTDLGGADGSRRSVVLAQLERKGLIESRQRRPYTSGTRGSKIYRLTAAGLAAEWVGRR